MKDQEPLGKLSYEVSKEALHSIISSGRVMEFANTVAASAAREIHAQIVDQIAKAAIDGGLSSVSVSAINVFEGGDFATVPKGPRPKIGLVLGGNALSHVVDLQAVNVRG
jgi:hypothetical protein